MAMQVSVPKDPVWRSWVDNEFLISAWVWSGCGGLTIIHEINGHRRPAGELWFKDVWLSTLEIE